MLLKMFRPSQHMLPFNTQVLSSRLMPKLQWRKPQTLSRWYEWSYDQLIPWCADAINRAISLVDGIRNYQIAVVFQLWAPRCCVTAMCILRIPTPPIYLFLLRPLLRPYTRNRQATTFWLRKITRIQRHNMRVTRVKRRSECSRG